MRHVLILTKARQGSKADGGQRSDRDAGSAVMQTDQLRFFGKHHGEHAISRADEE